MGISETEQYESCSCATANTTYAWQDAIRVSRMGYRMAIQPAAREIGMVEEEEPARSVGLQRLRSAHLP
jgi:phage anti-repressor protein